MTRVHITIDTEYSALLALQGCSQAQNFARSISCETSSGNVGIEYQMDVFDRHGLLGDFFVDPMPAMLWGIDAVAQIVRPIVERGHGVELHIHTEWLEIANRLKPGANPLGGRTGRNMADFTHHEQAELLDYARALLIKAGAPPPVAFRAGNYGANDDTLRALAPAGLRYDTSHCPGIARSECAITLSPDDRAAVRHAGAVEVPTSAVRDLRGNLRHAQITALSAREILSAIRHARDNGVDDFTLVSHSFELLSRDRMRINRLVKRRFERFCQGLGQMEGACSALYRNDPPSPLPAKANAPVLPRGRFRALERMAEQAVANALYGRG